MTLGWLPVLIARVLSDRRGASMAEYAILVALVATVAISALTTVNVSITRVFTNLTGRL